MAVQRRVAKRFRAVLPPGMAQFDHDVLVIGGGPAGSTAAAFARQKGLRVCVVEKDAFPRFKIGESLLPHGNSLLRASGVWPKVEAAGFMRKQGAYFFLSHGDAHKEVVFSEGVVRGLDYTYQVDRAKFDQLLLDHARELGAAVEMETTVTAVSTDADGCRATLTGPAGEKQISARWIIDAGGRDNHFQVELKRAMEPPRLAKRVAVYNHFQGVWRPSGASAGHTIVVRFEDGWFWLIPLDETRTSVGLVTSLSALKQQRDPSALFWNTVRNSPRLNEWMQNASAAHPFRTTSDYSYFRAQLASERLLLVGDAGGFFDPIFSSGVFVALNSAKLAVDCIARADAAGRALTVREIAQYTAQVKRGARVFEKLIHAFYDKDKFAVFLSQQVPFRIDRGVNSIVAGHARLTWPIWWRFKLFLLVCRLQKFVRIVQPVGAGTEAR